MNIILQQREWGGGGIKLPCRGAVRAAKITRAKTGSSGAAAF